MIVGIGRDGDRPLMVLILSQGNIDRLIAGDPIHVREGIHGENLPAEVVVAVAGESMGDIIASAQKAFPGVEIKVQPGGVK